MSAVIGASESGRRDVEGLQRVARAPAGVDVVYLKVPDGWVPGKTLAVTVEGGQRLAVAVPPTAQVGSLLKVTLPSGSQGVLSLRLIAPPDARPGQAIHVKAGERLVLVKLPLDVQPGLEYEFRLPAETPLSGASGAPQAPRGATAAEQGPRPPSLLQRVGGSLAAKVDTMRQHKRAGAIGLSGSRSRYGQMDDSMDTEMYI